MSGILAYLGFLCWILDELNGESENAETVYTGKFKMYSSSDMKSRFDKKIPDVLPPGIRSHCYKTVVMIAPATKTIVLIHPVIVNAIGTFIQSFIGNKSTFIE